MSTNSGNFQEDKTDCAFSVSLIHVPCALKTRMPKPSLILIFLLKHCRGGSYDLKVETKSVENEVIQKQSPEETTKKLAEDVDSKIQAARERYLARKAKK